MITKEDIKAEERETKRVRALVKALDYSLAGALDFHGFELRGFSITYEPFMCTMVLKAVCNNKHYVAFISSDTMMNCLLAADSAARRGAIKWGKDKYHPDEV